MNLADNLFKSTEKFADRTAVVFYDRRLRYAEVCDAVSRLAAAFTERGWGAGARVAVALPNVPEFITAYYATHTAGAELVPINPLYTAREIDFMLTDSNPALVITHPMFEQTVRAAIGDRKIEVLFSDNLGDPAKPCIADLIRDHTQGMSPVKKAPDDVAVIAYTNAVSGYPMGAMLTHEGLSFVAESSTTAAVVNENDAFLTVIPLYHAFSATTCMNLPIMNGAMTVLNETFSEKRVVDILENEPISIFPAVPAIFQRIYDVYGGSGKDFSKLKAFIPGGAPLDMNLLHKFILAFNASVFEGYGITECGPVTSVNPIDRRINKPGSVGLPLHGISVKVVDPVGNELSPRTQGELCIYGKNVMKGYLNQPEMTGKYLKNGWLHTGDRAWLDEEGFIFLTGLIKEMFLVGGFNVYPAEVRMILNQHPDVEQSELYSVKDPAMGERIIAKVKLKQDSKTTATELRKYARINLAPYKVPRAIEIM